VSQKKKKRMKNFRKKNFLCRQEAHCQAKKEHLSNNTETGERKNPPIYTILSEADQPLYSLRPGEAG
jgi:hypothetical protein